jgi:hypothetical protein
MTDMLMAGKNLSLSENVWCLLQDRLQSKSGLNMAKLLYIHAHCSTVINLNVFTSYNYRYMFFVLLNDVVYIVDDVNFEFRGDPF